MKIIMMGAPGAGKGTRAAFLAENFNIPHISTGDIFRANLKEGTEYGLKAKEYMDKGQLVPDELTVKILLDRVKKDDCLNGYVLDGFPRTIRQAEILDEELLRLNDKIDYVIDVDVSDEVIKERMSGRRVCTECSATYHIIYNKTKEEGICDKCGGEVILRADDAERTVDKRLKVYHEETFPLIEFYEKRGILEKVDGSGSLSTALSTVVKIIEQKK